MLKDSASYIFGNLLGDPIADTIFYALKRDPEGMTRTQISELLGRHVPANKITAALQVLMKANLATCRTMQSHGGRPTTIWYRKPPAEP